MNLVVMDGRLTADPEIKVTPSGVPVTSFTIAVNRPKNKDGQQESDFFRCVAWRNVAENICKWWHKGKPIIVEGVLRNRNYTDRDGVKRTLTEIVVGQAHFTISDSKANGTTTQSENLITQMQEPDNGFIMIDDNDDLPF